MTAEGVAPRWGAQKVSSETRAWLRTLLVPLGLRFQVSEEPQG